MAILRKVRNTRWGFDCKIIAIIAHALLESLIDYGLAISQIGAIEMNPAERTAAGVDFTRRRAILHLLADLRAARNRNFSKPDKLLDRVLIAVDAEAHRHLQDFLIKLGRTREKLVYSAKYEILHAKVANAISSKKK